MKRTFNRLYGLYMDEIFILIDAIKNIYRGSRVQRKLKDLTEKKSIETKKK